MHGAKSPTTAIPPTPCHARPRRLALGLLALLLLSAALGYLDRQAVAVVSPTLKSHFGLRDLDWGWVNAFFSLAYFFSTLLGGVYIDRIGVRLGLSLSVAFWSLAAAGHALATGFWSLCMWRMLLALGEGPGYSAMLKGARRLMPPRLRDTGAGLVSASTVLGALMAPLLIVPLTVYLGWQSAFVIPAGIGLLWLPCWVALASRPQANLGPEPILFASGSDEAPRRLQGRSRALWATLLLIFFMMPSTIFVNNFLALYLSRAYSLTQADLGWVLWQPFLAADIGQLVGGVGVYCLLRRGWTFLSARGFVLSVGLVGATVTVAANGAADARTAVAWLCLSRFCFMAAHTALIAYGIESVTEEQTGLMTGVMNATFSASNFVFSPLVGWLADRYDYGVVLAVVAWSPMLGLGCWQVLSRLHARGLVADVNEAV